MQSSGDPLLDGINLSTESLNNLEKRQRQANAAENGRLGNSSHLSLEQTAIFPPMMLYMVASGEKSGQLGTLMVRAADNQETLQQNRIAHLSLEQTAIFPPMMLYMVASGEKSGQLGTLMVRAADNQETLQQNRIALTLSIFEPALIITLALIVLFIVVSVLQPLTLALIVLFIVVSVLQPLLQLNSMIN